MSLYRWLAFEVTDVYAIYRGSLTRAGLGPPEKLETSKVKVLNGGSVYY